MLIFHTLSNNILQELQFFSLRRADTYVGKGVHLVSHIGPLIFGSKIDNCVDMFIMVSTLLSLKNID